MSSASSHSLGDRGVLYGESHDGMLHGKKTTRTGSNRLKCTTSRTQRGQDGCRWAGKDRKAVRHKQLVARDGRVQTHANKSCTARFGRFAIEWLFPTLDVTLSWRYLASFTPPSRVRTVHSAKTLVHLLRLKQEMPVMSCPMHP